MSKNYKSFKKFLSEAPGDRAIEFDKKRATFIADRLRELSAKDPSQLSSKETAELSLLKSSLQGEVATKGLETQVRSELSKMPVKLDSEVTGDSVTAQQERDMATVAGQSPDAVLSKTVGRSQEELTATSRSQQAREQEAARIAKQKRDAEWAEDARRARKDVVIKGTKMTYGQFEDQYGRPYDAMNAEDRDMLIRAASDRSAFRVSPTARAYDQTVVDFNRAYRDQNARMAGELGKADRRVDAAQMALDQFNADRKGTVQREISRIQAQPGFVRGVAQDMENAVQDAKFRAESDKIRGEMAGEQGPPRSAAELSRMMRDAREAPKPPESVAGLDREGPPTPLYPGSFDQTVTQAAQNQTQKEAGKIADRVSNFTELTPVETESGEGFSDMIGRLINQLPEPRPTAQQTANKFVDKTFMRQFQKPSTKSKVNLQSNLPTEARNSLDRYVSRRRA